MKEVGWSRSILLKLERVRSNFTSRESKPSKPAVYSGAEASIGHLSSVVAARSFRYPGSGEDDGPPSATPPPTTLPTVDDPTPSGQVPADPSVPENAIPPSAPITTLPNVYFDVPLFSEGSLEVDDQAPPADRPILDENGQTVPILDADGQPIPDGDAVHYNDVNQQRIKDCFLMAAVASLAMQDPQAIRDMIDVNTDEAGNVTSYTVTLYDNGNPVLVEVTPDDIYPNGARPTENGENWVAVVEAAFYEYRGDAASPRGGNSSDAMEILTGRPSTVVPVESGEYTFDEMQDDLEAGRLIVLSTKQTLDENEYWIWSQHSYVVERMWVAEDGTQMVQLYNPWGHEQPPPIPFDEIPNFFDDFQIN